MHIRVGYRMTYNCPQPTPMILMTSIHYSRVSDLVHPDHVTLTPPGQIVGYRDSFGNWCLRTIAPPGDITITASSVVNDAGRPDPMDTTAAQVPVPDLPEDTLLFLVGSRYCETDKLSETAWKLFQHAPQGWHRVQAICNFVHSHITFSYESARSTKSAFEVFHERQGVCRDYAHLAVAFCRAMNIPARYCTGYLSDIGVPPPYGPMDFAAWFEAFLGGQWHIFDPRNNARRIGRVLIARGRDAADVPIANTFGPNTLTAFQVWTDEVSPVTP